MEAAGLGGGEEIVMRTRLEFCLILSLAYFASLASGDTLTYNPPFLNAVYPAGGQPGETLEISFRGPGIQPGETKILIDGPPGVSFVSNEPARVGFLKATLKIAPDAAPGMRELRVLHLQHGPTNYRLFEVSPLPHSLEKEPNNVPAQAQTVSAPTVVDASIDPTLDVDCFRFEAKAGRPILARVLAHGMDGILDVQKGYLDTSLRLLDPGGKVVATSEDALGRDPVISLTAPADGVYTVEVRSVGNVGSSHAVYRLTLGEVPLVTAAFPAGGERGKPFQAELVGLNLPASASAKFTPAMEGTNPTFVAAAPGAAGVLNLARGNSPESLEAEPNGENTQANPLPLPGTVNGRFLEPGDEDIYRIELAKNQTIILETLAQRDLRLPLDTEIRVSDATGKELATNDDGLPFGKGCQFAHDFPSNDSWLSFRPPADGEYFVKVRDLSGASGPRAIYRLSAQVSEPDFALYQWPDAVPVWGPGTTTSFYVEVAKWGGVTEDIQLRVEGLPAGWTGSAVRKPKEYQPSYDGTGAVKLIMTLGAPADAAIGTVVPFRVIGKLEQGGRVIEREARYMTLYGGSHSDRMHLRYSDGARAAVCQSQGAWVEALKTEVTGKVGDTVQIPVRIHNAASKEAVDLVANGPTPSASCAWSSPVTVEAGTKEFMMPVVLGNRAPGTYGIVVGRAWASDTRKGCPGPCTVAIQLKIEPN